MSDKKKTAAAAAAKEQSYRLAKLLRSGSRELARQLNSKKIRRDR